MLTGRVLNEKGKPIPDAVVDLWIVRRCRQLRHGRLQVPRLPAHRRRGPLRVHDASSRAATSRASAKHLHVKVQGDSQPITTQLYIEGEPGNEDDHYYSSELLVRATEDANGTKHGTFDFVIKQVTERENVTPESLAARV